jgi:hypothetical protein
MANEVLRALLIYSVKRLCNGIRGIFLKGFGTVTASCMMIVYASETPKLVVLPVGFLHCTKVVGFVIGLAAQHGFDTD